MSDQSMQKPPGKGKGKWLNAGVQAQQASDIESLKAAFALHIQDHEDAEGGDETTPEAPEEGADTTPSA